VSEAETVLVTGATGTVGSVVARVLAENGVPVRALSRCGAARVSAQLSELLGRPPITFQQFATDHADAFR
jgi:uncharacterized protein YbjT (DUF2867 family)